MRGQNAAIGGFARLLLRFKHDGAGAIAEQHAGAAIVPVENSRECLGADHQRALERAGAQEIVGGGKREDEPRAHRLQVEGRAVVDAERRSAPRPRSAGKVLSGVEVASTIRSIDCASIPALASAARAAWIARSEVNSPSAAMWRCRMPVRCTIHSSEVSIRAASSALVRISPRQIGAAAEHDRTYRSHETASCAVGAEPARCRRD